jgi:RNA polymerase sigma-70 factor (ECF subfamily)
MPLDDSTDFGTRSGAPVFSTTHWSLVLAAQGDDSGPAAKALASLCESYWYPLYAFVRRRGYGPHDAQDLTQAFFEKLLEKNTLKVVSQEKGRFRSFLLGALKHFLANEWDRSRAAKRGGGTVAISLDQGDAEARYRLEPADEMSADRLFERRWAMTLLDQVMKRLREEMESAGKAAVFEELKDHLMAGGASAPFAEAGERLGLSEGAARVAAHRLRKRYRELLQEEIAQTVADPSEVEDEIRHLISVLAGENPK